MKRNLTLLALASIIFASCATRPEVADGMFLIKGNIKNVADSSIVNLMCPMGGGAFITVQSDTIIGGKFEFCDSITDTKDPYRITSQSDGFTHSDIYVWIDSKSYIEIEGESGALQTWTVKSDNQMQKEENDYLKYILPVIEKEFELSKEINKATFLMYKKMWAKQDFKKEYYAADSLGKLYDPVDEAIDFKQLEYFENTPVSEHWLFSYFPHIRFMEYKKNEDLVAKIKSIYGLIPENYLSTPMGKDITTYMYPPQVVNVGDTLPDATLYDLDGNKRYISELKGKYVLLDFWSQACGPCIASIPELKEISEMYKDTLSVVSINSEGENAWKQAVKTHKLDGYQWNEKVNVPLLNKMMDMSGIPAYVLLTPEGIVQEKWTGYGKGSLKNKFSKIFK